MFQGKYGLAIYGIAPPSYVFYRECKNKKVINSVLEEITARIWLDFLLIR
jgi:hypothetical protein